VAIGPHLPVVDGQDAFAKPIKRFRATEYTFGSRTEGMKDQVISPGIKENNDPNRFREAGQTLSVDYFSPIS
jgi:hypothetical protein